jgi:hypothetical protein
VGNLRFTLGPCLCGRTKERGGTFSSPSSPSSEADRRGAGSVDFFPAFVVVFLLGDAAVFGNDDNNKGSCGEPEVVMTDDCRLRDTMVVVWAFVIRTVVAVVVSAVSTDDAATAAPGVIGLAEKSQSTAVG